jgi:RND family efflux transporter MFP subunit
MFSFPRRLAPFTVVLATSLMLTACNEESVPDPRLQAPLVRVTYPQKVEQETRTFTGIVAARVQSDAGFRVQGKVLERFVSAGQTVVKGQPLMRVDPIDLTLQAKAQKEAVAAAKARAQQAQSDEKRYREILKKGLISASVYASYKAASDVAKAELSAAQSQADVALNASKYSTLIADSDGVVMDTFAEPGQVVAPGQAVVRIAHAGQREAIIYLPETLRPELGSTGRATLYNPNGEQAFVSATLRQLSDVADSITRTFEARYVLSGALANAPLGVTVKVELPNTRQPNDTSFDLPIGALYDNGKDTGIWRIESASQSSRVVWQPVNVMRISAETVNISANIKSTDPVVALGAHLLSDKEAVRVNTGSLSSVKGGGAHE